MANVDVLAPSAGSVIEVHVAAGQQVSAQQELMIIESMKMEIPIVAEVDGTIAEVLVAVADPVNNGDVVLRINAS
jgi:acetyl-CoA carboxylase biotin carboxyl carrier protein